MREQEVIEIFDNFSAQELEISFQNEVCLETEVDIRYIKTGEEEIKFYVNNISKPDIEKYVDADIKPTLDDLVIQAQKYADRAEDLVNNKIENITETRGSISLQNNKNYQMSIEASVDFLLPDIVDEEIVNTITMDLHLIEISTIDWGTAFFFGDGGPDILSGHYAVIWDYSNKLGSWVCGLIYRGV